MWAEAPLGRGPRAAGRSSFPEGTGARHFPRRYVGRCVTAEAGASADFRDADSILVRAEPQLAGSVVVLHVLNRSTRGWQRGGAEERLGPGIEADELVGMGPAFDSPRPVLTVDGDARRLAVLAGRQRPLFRGGRVGFEHAQIAFREIDIPESAIRAEGKLARSRCLTWQRAHGEIERARINGRNCARTGKCNPGCAVER